MSEHPPEVYAHLQSIKDGTCRVWVEYHPEFNKAQVCSSDPSVLPWVGYCVQNKLTDWRREIRDEGDFKWEDDNEYIITGDGLKALWEHSRQKETTTKQAGSVNARMAAMLLADATLIELSATEWATKLGDCSDGAVKQTQAWQKIMDARAIQKSERREKDKGKRL